MSPVHLHILRVAGLACTLAMASAAASDPMDQHIAMMDTNKDGKVSADEHAAGVRKMFATMDANKDGKVSAAEMMASHKAMMGKKAGKDDLSAEEKIRVLDKDGDGTLTQEEHDAGAAAMFTKMDANADGFLTKSEMAAGHRAMLHKPAK